MLSLFGHFIQKEATGARRILERVVDYHNLLIVKIIAAGMVLTYTEHRASGKDCNKNITTGRSKEIEI